MTLSTFETPFYSAISRREHLEGYFDILEFLLQRNCDGAKLFKNGDPIMHQEIKRRLNDNNFSISDLPKKSQLFKYLAMHNKENNST